jgi:serine/threonine protein kinase
MTRYELLERIGFGGMAEVFRGVAIAAEGFEKPVAIKRILPHLSEDARFVELLIAEAKFLSQLRHRNIVQIYDVGLGDDGQYFLVMEYVDGLNLGKLYEILERRGKRLPADIALHIGAEVCDALDHAHRARGPDGQPLGLVHRDVSPSNVLLSQSGEVKLTDFGIAKRMEDHTGHGGVRGKFAYISPEQASSQPVDGRSDVFSLGIVLYELVLGHRLFSHLADFEALRAVLEGRVKRPRSIDSALSEELEEILLSALAHEPDQRFSSAAELGSQLRSYRYTALSSSGDPAAELASIVDRYGKDEDSGEVKEATMVHLLSASGFTGHGPERDREFREARAIIDAFEEETRAVELDAAELFARSGDDTGTTEAALDDEATTIMASAAPEDASARPPSYDDYTDDDDRGAAAGRIPLRATPPGGRRPPLPPPTHLREPPLPKPREPDRGDRTIRELHYDDEPESADSPPTDELRRPHTQPARQTRGSLGWTLLAGAAIALSAFLLASAYFSSGESRAGAASSQAATDGATPDEASEDSETAGEATRPEVDTDAGPARDRAE